MARRTAFPSQGIVVYNTRRFKVVCSGLEQLISTLNLRACQNHPGGKSQSEGGCFLLMTGGKRACAAAVWGLCKQPAGRWELLLSVSSPSWPPSICLSLQNAVGAEGTATDVTGSRPLPFSTLPVLIRCSRAHGHRPVYTLPPDDILALDNLFRVCLKKACSENCSRQTKLRCKTHVVWVWEGEERQWECDRDTEEMQQFVKHKLWYKKEIL